jgi:hypothetical protein
MSVQNTGSTIERFNAVRWHDSKLLGLSLCRVERADHVKIFLGLLEEGGLLTPTELVFEDPTYIALQVDLEGKRLCADDISSAKCHASSEWIRRLSEQNPLDNFGGYLHFEIDLIPPGGTIDILAKDFVLTTPAPT